MSLQGLVPIMSFFGQECSITVCRTMLQKPGFVDALSRRSTGHGYGPALKLLTWPMFVVYPDVLGSGRKRTTSPVQCSNIESGNILNWGDRASEKTYIIFSTPDFSAIHSGLPASCYRLRIHLLWGAKGRPGAMWFVKETSGASRRCGRAPSTWPETRLSPVPRPLAFPAKVKGIPRAGFWGVPC